MTIHLFDLLNEEFFECELSRPTITIQSTPKAYGHFSLREDTWISKVGGTHEINIGAGTLSRPIEEVAATLLHEMVHYYNHVNGIQDCSRGNTYRLGQKVRIRVVAADKNTRTIDFELVQSGKKPMKKSSSPALLRRSLICC